MKGYFWVSYYDANFGRALAVFNGVASAGNYDAIYQYDALGRSAWVSADGGGQAWYANRFTCAGTGEVAAASFYTPVPGHVLRGAGGAHAAGHRRGARRRRPAPSPSAGTTRSGSQQPVAVTAGDTFVVAVRVTTPGWTDPVPVEAPSGLIAPRARAGQSYVSADGSAWTDLTLWARSPATRARTSASRRSSNAAGAGDTRPPHVELRGGIVRRGRQGRDPLAARRTRPSPAAARSSSSRVRDAAGRVDGPAADPRRRRRRARGVEPHRELAAGRYCVRGRAYDVAGRRQATATRAAVVVRGVAPPAVAADAGQKHRR